MTMSTIKDPVDRLIEELESVELLAEDGQNLETLWHRACINLLIESILYQLRGRDDFFVGGNMFIYFNLDQARNRDFRGPDFFFVDGVSLLPQREYWATWLEGGRYPDVIIELLSPSTAEEDRTTKYQVYQDIFHTRNYYCYDPFTRQLEGWEFRQGQYEPLTPDAHGRLWCSALGLWLGTWEGEYQRGTATWLRWYDPEGNLVLLEEEAARQRAEQEHQRAEQEAQRAEQERQRAEAAEAELARLRELLARQQEERGENGEE
jgi:Uma2 family endonuclease